jgi:glutathione synthase/RimK-type ligase-like ATP-grasp enzyme
MKIAIHKSGGFSDRWIEYCEKNHIDYKIVNAYDSDIVEQVMDCDAFMWHFFHNSYKDALFAKQLLFSLQQAGKRVFPDFNSGWHFDDKVGQKYLLEAIGAPLVPSYVFYTKEEALDWIEKTTFPKVFKLRGGAGATNVRLAKTKRNARRLVKKAFSNGFAQKDFIYFFKDKCKKYKNGTASLKEVLNAFARIFVGNEFAKMHAPEKGYAYFQDFIPNNSYDTRIVIIGEQKAMVERRYVRKGDFRASGSGKFEYVKADDKMLQIAFNVAKSLSLQSVAFDFIYKEEQPMIVEMSFGFGTHGIVHCGGYYTQDLEWHDEVEPDFCGWMIEDLIK